MTTTTKMMVTTKKKKNADDKDGSEDGFQVLWDLHKDNIPHIPTTKEQGKRAERGGKNDARESPT